MESTQISAPWRECCPNCGSHSFYILTGKHNKNPGKFFKRGASKKTPKGYRCTKCKVVFQAPKDKLESKYNQRIKNANK